MKLVRHTRLWPGLLWLPDDAARAELIDFYPWQYELDIHQSGIGSVLPDGMRTPQLHHVSRPDAEAALLQPELVSGAPPNVLTAAMRAQELLDTSGQVLGDPETRRRYDEAVGLRRSGGGPVRN